MSYETLILPFQFEFMQNAFLIALIVSIPSALLSCFLVMKGWALMGDAVSHAVLPGIVFAYIIGAPLILGAFIAGIGCSLATGYLSNNCRVKQDSIMGVVFSGMFGLGIVLYVSVETNAHLDHILFGNILGVEQHELWTTGIISFGVSIVLILKWKDWLLHSFDPVQARTSGLNVNLLHFGMLTALSLTIIAILSAAGLILAIGLVIAPGATAFLLVRKFSMMLCLSTVICIFSMMFGTYISFFLDSAPAPTIVLVMTIIFLAALVKKQYMVSFNSTFQQ
ncbi:MAG: metal ABC transporter permease [Rhodobacteraceae bacterium]|jgi:manganese/iron transport system permease protein|nr:MAG: metal ABC transporter permease [Paracoccaceae bacterium]|tara:strand:+ start:2777 stop:3616 length:840 start_codon:yes stop_codon:yes gene_type:complete